MTEADMVGMQNRADGAPIAPPTWAHGLAALAGLALLIGPTLAVLWPG